MKKSVPFYYKEKRRQVLSTCVQPYIENQGMMNWIRMMNLKSFSASSLTLKVLCTIIKQIIFIFATFIGNKSRKFSKNNAEAGIKSIPKFVHRPFFSHVKGKLLGTRLSLCSSLLPGHSFILPL